MIDSRIKIKKMTALVSFQMRRRGQDQRIENAQGLGIGKGHIGQSVITVLSLNADEAGHVPRTESEGDLVTTIGTRTKSLETENQVETRKEVKAGNVKTVRVKIESQRYVSIKIVLVKRM